MGDNVVVIIRDARVSVDEPIGEVRDSDGRRVIVVSEEECSARLAALLGADTSSA